MAKFYGVVGYGEQVETSPGVWSDEITERPYFGDLVTNLRRQLRSSGKFNDDIAVTNDISIVADPFAVQNFQKMLYVEYLGVKWKIANVEVQHPRLILNLGGIYNAEEKS